jgi:hypothetical protein
LKTEPIGTARPSIAHSDFFTVATTQNHYIKTASPDAIAAMKQFSEALLCSTFAPDRDVKAKGSVGQELLSAYL